MSGFLRRIAALLLGVIVGVAGGAFWIYQNIKPLQMLGKNEVIEGTEISQASVEELAELIIKATKNPDDFSFARLEKEYGLDLKKILQQAGINTDNANQEDMNALQNISLLSLINGAESFLDNIKLRALYVILPSVMDKDLDEILSKEAQAALGDYTLWQLLNSDAATEELGLITALKALKVGALLPSVFDANYNADKHEYTYTVKEGSKLEILNLFADVPLKAVIDLANGEDPVKSLMEGELKVLGDKPLSEILSTLFSVAGSEAQDKLDKFARFFGDSTLSDLFEAKGDKYVLTFNNVAEEIDFGYIFGFEKDENGVWYKDAAMTEPVDGLLELIANLDLKALATADGDVIKTINAVVGDMSITTIYETFVDGNKIPKFVQALGDLTVSDILRNGTKDILPTVIESLNMYIGDWSLGQALNDILSPAQKEKIADSALLTGLMNLRFGDFLKEEYTADTFINAFDRALGEIELGSILGKEKVDGKWQGVNNVLGIALDVTVGDIFDVIRADNYTEAMKALFGNVTIGDFYGAIFDYTSTEEDPIYHKGDKYVTEGFNEFLGLEFWKLMATFDKNSGYNIANDFKKLTIGDVIYSGVGTFTNIDKYLSYENGEVALGGKLDRFAGASAVFLNETIANYKENWKKSDFWVTKLKTAYDELTEKDKQAVLIGGGAIGAVLYEVDNPLLVKLVKKLFGEDAIWYNVLGKTLGFKEVDGKFVGERFYNSFMDRLLHANVAETLTKGYPFLKNFKDVITLGNMLTLTDKLTAKVEKSIKIEFIEGYDGTPTIGGDLINLADVVLDIPLSCISRVDGKIKIVLPYKVNELMMGDLFAFYANTKSTTGFKATLSEDRQSWSVESEKLQEIYNNFFNLTVWQVRKEKGTLLKEVLGDTMLSELVSAFDTSWEDDSLLTTIYNVKAIDFIELITGNKPLKEVYGTVTLKDALGGYLSANIENDSVVAATLDLTVGEIADVFTAQSKRVAVKALVFDLYRDLYVRDFVNTAAKFANMSVENYIKKLPTGSKLINKVLDYQIGYFETSTKAQIKEMLNNLYLGDLVAELAVKVDRRFAFITHNITENADGTYFVEGDFAVLANKLYNLSFGEMYQMLLNKTKVRDYIYSFKLGDFGSDIARMGYNYIMKNLGAQRRHYVDYDGENYIASGDFALVANKVYNLSVEEAYKMLRNKTLLKDFVAEFKVGDFIGEFAPAFYNRFMKNYNRKHIVEYVNGEYVVTGDFAIASARVYNLGMLDVFRMLKTPANMKAFIGEFKLGDFTADLVPVVYRKFFGRFNRKHSVEYVNGEYVVTGDFDIASAKLYNLSVLDAFRMFKTPANMKAFIAEFKLGDFTSDLAPVIYRKFFGRFGREHAVDYVNGEYVVTGDFEALSTKLYNLTLLDAYNMFMKEPDLRAFVGKLKVGDFTADLGELFLGKFLGKFNRKHNVEYADGLYTADGTMAELFTDIYNLTGSDLLDIYRKPSALFDKFNKPMGAYVKYAVSFMRWFAPNIFDTYIVKNADGTYSAQGNYAYIFETVINIELKDFYYNLKTGKATYLKNEILKNIRVGNLFKKGLLSYDEATDTWFDANGNEVQFGSAAQTIMMKKLYGLRITDLQGLDINKLVDGVYVGDISGYICDRNEEAGHKHDDTCVWLGLTKVYKESDLINLVELYMPLDAQDRVVAQTSLSSILNDGISIENMLGGTLLGDMLGLYFDGANWYEYKTVDGYRVIDENNNYVLGKMSSELNQAICGIKTNELLGSNGADVLVKSINDVKLGYVLGYDVNEYKQWVKDGSIVEGAMAKIASFTVSEIKNDFNHIIAYELTFADVLPKDMLNGNAIFKHLSNTTLANATEELYKMKVGVFMGYEQRGLYWYRNGVRVDDEVLDVLADYTYGNFAGANGYELYDENGAEVTFMKHLIDNISKNVSVKTLYPNAGMPGANGFDSLLDGDWKLADLSDNLMNKLKKDATLEQLIELGVFSDYFDVNNGENLTNMDKVFARLYSVPEEEARAIWTQLPMQEFMTKIMTYATMLQAENAELQAKLAQYENLGA